MVEPPRNALTKEVGPSAEPAEAPGVASEPGLEVALILSSGRTGTRFLAQYVDANFAGTVARHEPRGSRVIRLVSHAALEGRLSGARARQQLVRHARRQLRSIPPGCRYVESNPYLAGVARYLDSAFARPRMAHIVRDPRAAVRSALNHGNASGWKGLANRSIPFWFPRVERLTRLAPGASPAGRAAAWWDVANEQIEAAGAGSNRYRRFRFEDLFADPGGSSLDPLLRHLGLDPAEALGRGPLGPVNQGRLDTWPGWQEWPEAWCRELHSVCGERMAAYGYGDEPAWQERVAR